MEKACKRIGWLGVAALLIALVLGGCGVRIPPDVQAERNIVYETVGGRELRLDIYRPAKPSAHSMPALLAIHGGFWTTGDKKDIALFGVIFAKQGYVVVIPNYRLATEAKFPAAVEDCKAAVRWIRAHAADYGVDPDRIGAVGGSAGAYLAAMLGVTNDCQFSSMGGNRSFSARVQAVVALFGPYDLTVPMDWYQAQIVRRFLGVSYRESPETYRLASPIAYIARGAPPFLLVHGEKDTLVPLEQALRFEAALKKAGVPVRLVIVKHAGHALQPMPEDLWPAVPQPTIPRVARIVLRFLDGILKSAPVDSSPNRPPLVK